MCQRYWKKGSHSSQNNLIIGISLITIAFISTKGNLQYCENGDPENFIAHFDIGMPIGQIWNIMDYK